MQNGIAEVASRGPVQRAFRCGEQGHALIRKRTFAWMARVLLSPLHWLALHVAVGE